jgi:hypothetical protein
LTAGGYYNSFINHTLVSGFGMFLYTTNFESGGVISNAALGSFALQARTATITNGALVAGADVSLTADTLLASNVMIQTGRGLTLRATNRLTDGFYLTNGFNPNTTNLNFWWVGVGNTLSYNGLTLPIKPQSGDMLGTTISNTVSGPNRTVTITWAGQDFGATTAGYSSNAAVGHLILDAGTNGMFRFTGVSPAATNALYVDWLDLRNQATNRNVGNSNFVALGFNNNLVIYYARATVGGLDVADKMNGKNTNHLRWVPQYTGYFSATNMVYPDGTTNAFNASVVQSTVLDSDGDGIANGSDTTPFFVPSQWAVSIVTTNVPSPRALISWHSVPSATNTVQYSTDLVSWLLLTNFISPSLVPPAGGWPIVNLVSDPIGVGPMRIYQVMVYPNTTNLYGP